MTERHDAVQIEGVRVLVGGAREPRRSDLWIVEGRISFSPPRRSPPPERCYDGSGLLALPSFVEIHAHLREPGGTESETIESGLSAALAGGYTTVFAMANTDPVNDRPEITRLMIESAARSGLPVDLRPVSAATKGLAGREPADFRAQKRAGAGAVSDDGFPILDDEVMKRCVVLAAEAGLPLFSHCTHHPRRPGAALEGPEAAGPAMERDEENLLVARDVSVAEKTGAPVHLCHLSTVEGVAEVRRAKERGVPVTCEATPHHLVLTAADVEGPDFKMNPPLRDSRDRDALVVGLRDGTVDAVATDHAPHSPGSKAVGMERAPFGVIGMESAWPVLYTELVETGRIDLVTLAARFAAGPAGLAGLPSNRLEDGERARVVVVDPSGEFVLSADTLRSKSRNCPFLGRRLRGRVVATISGSRVSVNDLERFRSEGA